MPRSFSVQPDPDEALFALKMECGHEVYTTVELRLQYPDDYHYVWCPGCRKLHRDNYGRLTGHNIPTAWQPVTSVRSVPNESLRDVREWSTFILSRDILRIQPSVPKHRARPFPYVKFGGH